MAVTFTGCALPTASAPTSAASCGYGRIAYRTFYADQDRPFEGSSMAVALSDLKYTTLVRWNETEITAQKGSNWTFPYPATEILSIAGVNGSHHFDATLSLSLEDPCSTKAQRDAACERFPQLADVSFGYFEEGPGWRATGYGRCKAEPPVGS